MNRRRSVPLNGSQSKACLECGKPVSKANHLPWVLMRDGRVTGPYHGACARVVAKRDSEAAIVKWEQAYLPRWDPPSPADDEAGQ
jgi:hypothetical protein